MRRDLQHVIASQRAMLARLQKEGARLSDGALMRAYTASLYAPRRGSSGSRTSPCSPSPTMTPWLIRSTPPSASPLSWVVAWTRKQRHVPLTLRCGTRSRHGPPAERQLMRGTTRRLCR